MKQWEKSIVTESSSEFIKGSYIYNVSSNFADFIRASTKHCLPGADLDSLNQTATLELSTFNGHRINVLFYMNATVFYYRDHIRDFINS